MSGNDKAQGLELFVFAPDRNNDIYNYCEISEAEYKEIIQRYPENYVSHDNDNVIFSRRYVEDHKCLLYGRNC